MGLKAKLIDFSIKCLTIVAACICGFLFLGMSSDSGSGSGDSGSYSSAGGSDILVDYIANFENGPMLSYLRGNISSYSSNPLIYLYITEDKSQYLCGEDYNKKNTTRNFGFGVCHRHEGVAMHVNEYQKYGIDITKELYDHIDGAVVDKYENTETNPDPNRLVRLDVDLVNNVKRDLLNNKFMAKINEECANANVTLPDHKKHAYCSLKYQQGTERIIGDFNNAKNTSMWKYCVDYTAEQLKSMTKSERASMLAARDYSGDGDSDGLDKRRQSEWLLWSTGVYVTMDGNILNPEDYTDSVATIQKTDSFENYLFIGDSITVGLANEYGGISSVNSAVGSKGVKNNEFKNAHFYAKVGQTAGYWNTNLSTLPTEDIKAICVLLGVNEAASTNNTRNMKPFIDNLVQKYGTSKPIYIQRVFPVGSAYTYIDNTTMNGYIKQYNDDIKRYILDKGWSNVHFIDTSDGLVDNSGRLMSDKSSGDGLHLNSNGNAQWVKNLKSKFLK